MVKSVCATSNFRASNLKPALIFRGTTFAVTVWSREAVLSNSFFVFLIKSKNTFDSILSRELPKFAGLFESWLVFRFNIFLTNVSLVSFIKNLNVRLSWIKSYQILEMIWLAEIGCLLTTSVKENFLAPIESMASLLKNHDFLFDFCFRNKKTLKKRPQVCIYFNKYF